MANVYAVKTGNWSDTTVWNTGAAYSSSGAYAVSGTTTIFATGPLVAESVNGVLPYSTQRLYPVDSSLTSFYLMLRGETPVSGQRPSRTLYLTNAYDASHPSASNVRSGVTCGAGNSLTGTCAVPPATSVAVGVPVDNTIGTASLSADNIRSALGLNSANLDVQLSNISGKIMLSALNLF